MTGYFKDIWDGVATVLIGMRITWSHLFTKSVTIQYPNVKVKLPERARNRTALRSRRSNPRRTWTWG
jgi:formate hydrogenlyase subunit 6/NADH:ubiquinone oxidoreductase subunit I